MVVKFKTCLPIFFLIFGLCIYARTTYASNYGDGNYGNNAYGASISVPTLTTSLPTLVSTSTVTFNGNITADGNASTTIRGFNYGTTNSYGSATSTSGTYGISSYAQTVTGLTCGTLYHFQASSTNEAGAGVSSDRSFTTNPCSDYSKSITETDGGTVSHIATAGNSVTLTVPASVSSTNLEFSVTDADPTTVVNLYSKPSSSLSAASAKAYILSSHDTSGNAVSSFSHPITVTMSYNTSDISGITESSLSIYRYDGSSWHALDSCVVDTTAKTVSCTTTAFSTFAIFGTSTIVTTTTTTTTTVAGNGSPGGGGSYLPDYLKSRQQIIYPDGRVVYMDNPSTSTPVFPYRNPQLTPGSPAPSSPSTATAFAKSLSIGQTNSDVKRLQVFLNNNGFTISKKGAGSPGKESTYFGSLTKAALIKFQIKYKIVKSAKEDGAGSFGPKTRGKVNSMR